MLIRRTEKYLERREAIGECRHERVRYLRTIWWVLWVLPVYVSERVV